MPHDAPTRSPTDPGRRIVEIDIIRGFALFGVLLVNMLLFAYPSLYYEPMGMPGAGTLNRVVELSIRILAEGSFIAIFAFLFGLGFGMRSPASGANMPKIEPALLIRRLAALFVLGVLHGSLVWMGDILALFAVSALALLFLSGQSGKTAIRLAVSGILLSTVLMSLQAFRRQSSLPDDVISMAVQTYRAGSFTDITLQRMNEFIRGLLGQVLRSGPQIAGLFILGAVAGARRLHVYHERNHRLYRRIMWSGLATGLTIKLLYAVTVLAPVLKTEPDPVFASVARGLAIGIGGPALGFAYMTALFLALRKAAVLQYARSLSYLGRMTLSNYIFQSLIATVLFYGYGFGLYGRYGAAFGFLMTIALYALQIPLSMIWLTRFRYGPLENLVRSFVYGRTAM